MEHNDNLSHARPYGSPPLQPSSRRPQRHTLTAAVTLESHAIDQEAKRHLPTHQDSTPPDTLVHLIPARVTSSRHLITPR
ncbi:hypothetical protein E2C01_077011 [Portunus trituberculatus]|uniref:Uncharacterized protein n=1 Tax=Portunus trituberculatus TaxID=210409 RepID=A0A5B7IEP7_PORTR|nr:hypothetical protein [Portunus trituberculatus]